MSTRNFSLTPDLEAYIKAKVDSGEYLHASEVIRDALRLMMQGEADKLDWLRNAIEQGSNSPVRCDLDTPEKVVEEVKRHGRQLLAARKAQKR